MHKMWVQSLGWENPLERGMVTHSSILAWEIPWTEEPPGLQSMWLQRVRHDLVTKKNKNQQTIHMQMITAFSPQALVANQTMFQGIYGCGNEQMNTFRKIIYI